MSASHLAIPRASATLRPVLSALLLAASLSAPMAAQAQAVQLMDFEGLACGDDRQGSPSLQMTNEGGLNWGNFYCLKADTYVSNPSGYPAGATSGSNVGYNGSGILATLTRPGGEVFSLVDAQITAAWMSTTVIITGKRMGAVVGTLTETISNSAPTRVDLSSLANVDEVTLIGVGTQVALDDLRYILGPVTSVKPVPTLGQWSLALMALLMGGLGLHAQRRKARG